MDFHEWKAQVQSGDQQLSANLPKTIQLEDHHQWQAEIKSPSSTLTLFTPEHSSSNNEKTTITSTHLPSFPFPKMSLEQWQELQLQALIYKYMISGVSVPLELILPIRRCLFSRSLYYHQTQLHHHFGPSVFQSGYWGRCAEDPAEPGRCRRTDGKKWRCSREAMKGQKYCERHVHRGRNRSRKHVEASSPPYISCFKTPNPSLGSDKEHHLSIDVSLYSSAILPLNIKGTPKHKEVEGDLQSNSFNVYKCDRHVFRSFLDESPRQQGEFNSAGKSIHSSSAANSSSDFSLRLSTGNDPTSVPEADGEAGLVQQTPANWLGSWANTAPAGASSMGGPLAEALHPLALSNSPTSVLQIQHGLNL